MGAIDDVGNLLPTIEVTSFFSSTWIYILVLFLLGLILIGAVAFILYIKTYNRKMVFLENLSGKGYNVIAKKRARIVKLGVGGGELLKPIFSNTFFPSDGRKMGKNTYWFAKGSDGYWRNIVLGDLDTETGMLDIEPVDRDVRMFQIAIDRLSHQTYGKQSFMEKYGIHVLLFVFLIVLIFGMWFIVGKIGDATAPLAASTENAVKIQEANDRTLDKLAVLIDRINTNPAMGGTGLKPAPTNNTGGT